MTEPIEDQKLEEWLIDQIELLRGWGMHIDRVRGKVESHTHTLKKLRELRIAARKHEQPTANDDPEKSFRLW